MPLGSEASPVAGSPAPVRALIVRERRPARRGKTVPLGYQEPIRGNAQSGVMMEAAPAASLIMAQSEFLLQLLVIPFDDPALFGDRYQML